MEPKNVLLFAFANSDPKWGNYLRHLNNEQHALRDLFRPLEQRGKCSYIERANAGIDEIVKVLDDKDYQGNIAILHFAGHGDTEFIQAQGLDNRPELLDMDRFAEYLGLARCPHLVFLNACWSAAHARKLHEVGVACIIGTESAVGDEIATEFAEGFYRAIVDGKTISDAFDRATLNIEGSR